MTATDHDARPPFAPATPEVIATDAIGLARENEEQHGMDRETAERAAILEVTEGAAVTAEDLDPEPEPPTAQVASPDDRYPPDDVNEFTDRRGVVWHRAGAGWTSMGLDSRDIAEIYENVGPLTWKPRPSRPTVADTVAAAIRLTVGDKLSREMLKPDRLTALLTIMRSAVLAEMPGDGLPLIACPCLSGDHLPTYIPGDRNLMVPPTCPWCQLRDQAADTERIIAAHEVAMRAVLDTRDAVEAELRRSLRLYQEIRSERHAGDSGEARDHEAEQDGLRTALEPDAEDPQLPPGGSDDLD